MNESPTKRIESLGLKLPPAPKPAGVYRPTLLVDKFLYVSGQGPMKLDGNLIKGRVGKDLDLEQGKLAARQVGLTMLSSIQNHFGSIDKIKRVIKVLGMGFVEIKSLIFCICGAKRRLYPTISKVLDNFCFVSIVSISL